MLSYHFSEEVSLTKVLVFLGHLSGVPVYCLLLLRGPWYWGPQRSHPGCQLQPLGTIALKACPLVCQRASHQGGSHGASVTGHIQRPSMKPQAHCLSDIS